MRVGRISFYFFIFLAGCLAVLAQNSSSLRLYDDFNKDLIDPAKWYSSWNCYPSSTECARSIRNNQLRLRVRAYGSPDTNDGTLYTFSESYLTAAGVTDIEAQVVVRTLITDTCATNTSGDSFAHFTITGAFFNGGSGSSNDDVQAFLLLSRHAADPVGTARVQGFLKFQGQYFDTVDMGTINVGELVKVELLWEQPNHRFVIRLFRPSMGTQQEQYMPYLISDTTSAASPYKLLGARGFPANCMGSRPASDIEVLIDDVRTN
jgi:hypothetical protein